MRFACLILVTLALAGTAYAQPTALLVGGAVVGPSTGLWYAGHGGGKGMLIRTGTAVGIVVLASEVHSDSHALTALIGATLAVYLTSVVYDIHAAGRVARKWNADRGLTLAPAVIPATGGGKAPGAVLSMRF